MKIQGKGMDTEVGDLGIWCLRLPEKETKQNPLSSTIKRKRTSGKVVEEKEER
jgi:hypothetical protein